MGCVNPDQLLVFDWRRGKRVRSIEGMGKSVLCSARLSDGLFAATGWDAVLRIGVLNDWENAAAIPTAQPVVGLALAADGALVSMDRKGVIKVWRDGRLERACPGALEHVRLGTPVTVCAGRIVALAAKASVVIV